MEQTNNRHPSSMPVTACPDLRLRTGNETQHFCDILGYLYRIIHPDKNEDWIYRDAAKNVTQHIYTDGSTDVYAYDERSNLLQHTRPDGTSVHHAYDDLDQRFKTLDAEGGLWRYDYDQRGNIIEAIRLSFFLNAEREVDQVPDRCLR
ncbi:hypothetical protein ACJA3S_10010 [Pseudomonas sp. KnCO4]|uniref:hypothetical protein n=1 Tax=Pseudomonas sp. KnCO4 TaxID=3381355 RepID=UPI003877F4D4